MESGGKTAEFQGVFQAVLLIPDLAMPYPLHPAVVHFPIVLAVLLPLLTLAGVLVSRRATGNRSAWIAVAAFAVLLPLSAWGALVTGEQQEDVVEQVLSGSVLHGHEEAAEGFLAASALLAVVALLGLAPGAVGRVARISSVAAAVAVLALGYRVGESGGALVYTYGAASAYVDGTGAVGPDRMGGDEDDDLRRRRR